MEEELDIVTFSDEEGNEYDLEVIDYFAHEDEMYALLVDPASTEDEAAEVEVYIMRAVTEGDATTFLPADDARMDELAEIAERHLDAMAADLAAKAEACECGCGCTQEECAHEHGEDEECGCGGHGVEDAEYDGDKPCYCGGE